MVVGASCRDILQSALGHEFALRATADIDLGLAVASWAAYDELTGNLPVVGGTGIRYRVAGAPADLMPFGAVEDPTGEVTPAARNEPMSVWGFAEVFDAALPLALPDGNAIRIPTVAGYAALKLAAWLDRSIYGEYKDASDLATAVYWYTASPTVGTLLYETDHGQEILLREGADDSSAAARVLGQDIADILGRTRLSELARRWSETRDDLLYTWMTVPNAPGWNRSPRRRQALVQAMERGAGISSRR
jgi:predicted nucleotidyltransferase